jgi:hypothetical protein
LTLLVTIASVSAEWTSCAVTGSAQVGIATASVTTPASQSHIPLWNLTLINRQRTYALNDPAGAYPRNVFLVSSCRSWRRWALAGSFPCPDASPGEGDSKIAEEALRALEEQLRGKAPEGLARLNAEQLQHLAEAVREARHRQAAELEAAGDQALKYIPKVLRVPLRRVLG